ncbi:MAG: DegT/DnrJ/EryC1/StrS family aminotransferase [Tepidisphaeraceae bacterium]
MPQIADADKPAIAGGKPAKTTPYTKLPRYGEEEMAELKEAIAQGTLFYAQGKKVKALEQAFAQKHAAKFAVACSSGTASLHAACMAGGISPGDEVIVPPITDMGSILPVMWQGAIPIFTDLDPRTYNLSPAGIEKNITDKTRAIMAVHLAGNPCDMAAIKAIADSRKIFVIEDCAQAHGTTYDGKPVGSIGHVGCYSYNEFKHIACGDGGIVTTSDTELARKLRLSTDKGYDRSPGAPDRNATFLANNYRMTELQGAVAIAQLKKLDSIVQRRQSWCGRLTDRLKNKTPGVQLPVVQEGGTHTYWFYMMRVEPEKLGANADEFAAALKAEGLPAAAHYIGRPIYKYPLFTNHSAFERGDHPYKRVDYRQTKCPMAEAILDTCVVLAVNESYSDADLDDTVKGFERVVTWFQSKQGRN